MAGIFDTGIFDVGIFDHASVEGVASLTQAANTVATTGRVQVKATLSQTQAANTIVAIGRLRVAVSLDVVQDNNAVSATAAVALSAAPCLIRATVSFMQLAAGTAEYVRLAATVSYSVVVSRTCWDVVADREAA